MERQEICEDIKHTGEGLRRYLRTFEYIPSRTKVEADRIIAICKKIDGVIEKANQEIELLKAKGYEDGYQEGRDESLRQYTEALNSLISKTNNLREQELINMESLFSRFLNNLSKFISQNNAHFVEEYIRKFINKSKTDKIKILVSENIYNLITKNKSLPAPVEIVMDASLSADQVFIETDGFLSDAGIDRFFQEISL